MKQILQNPKTGKLALTEVPAPALAPGLVLVRNRFSVVSPGTEKMALDFARSSLVGKARSRPDLVRQVTRKLRQEGPLATYRTVMNRLDAFQPLGYACAGVVEAVAPDVTGVSPGDSVACAGAGYANHAEWVSVPANLVARAPEGVPLEKAAFATLGAIALQGLRIARPTLGEIAAVIGLGLLGQLSVQLLRANGCRVLGVDLDPERVTRARELGAAWGLGAGEDPTPWIDHAAAGHGADFALVTAASESSAPLQMAATLCRQKGRIVAVGATAMELERRSFYEKELELRMSMSYGPGRYDRRYEELGLDYPLPYVRWTEQRNLAAFLELVAAGSVDPARLDTRTVPFEEAESAYETLARGERGSLAVVFAYPEAETESAKPTRSLTVRSAPQPRTGRVEPGVALVGSGGYATSVLLPALAGAGGLRRRSIVSAGGVSARRAAERFGFETCGSDPQEVFADPSVDLVVIATRHDTHAALAVEALRAGKAVWLEKPVGLTPEEVDAVVEEAARRGGFLVVGYNRRFSRHTRWIREAVAGRRGPLAMQYTVAAGPTPRGTWLTDPKIGGGRIVGEACHFVDLCQSLAGSPPVEVAAQPLGTDPEVDDSVQAVIRHADGSVASLAYLASASPALPKERFEVSADGRTLSCENFRTTREADGRRQRSVNQDKGQATAVAEVLDALRRGARSPMQLDEIAAVSRATFAIEEAVRERRAVEVGA